MELFAEHRRAFQSLREHWDESLRKLQRAWDAGAERLRRELDPQIDPDALEQLLGHREEIAALRREVETLRREVEAVRGVRSDARRVNGAN
jgi:hypothetical protein